MKTPKEWAEEIRTALGNGLRYDPSTVSGRTMLEVMVERIQAEAASKTVLPKIVEEAVESGSVEVRRLTCACYDAVWHDARKGISATGATPAEALDALAVELQKRKAE